MKRFQMLFGIVLLLLTSSVTAGVPKLINFQGVLKTPADTVVSDGSYSVTFTIYNAPSGGINLWTETQLVATTGGLFAVLLGASNPLPDSAFQGSDRWLGIAVSPDPEMAVRQQLVSVGYAFRVNSVDSASGGTITSKVSIGPGHTNTGIQAFVAGQSHTASGTYSSISGGFSNSANGDGSTVGGGQVNNAAGTVSTISGGSGNSAAGLSATIGGGNNNSANFPNSVVAGGEYNFAGDHATVGGGGFNFARGASSVVAGGGGTVPVDSNSASGIFSTICGGRRNLSVGNYSVIGGGQFQTIFSSAEWATINGGSFNVAMGAYSTVGGGSSNSVTGIHSAIGGGLQNGAFGQYASIGGGHNNQASGYLAIIGGGYLNQASGYLATIGGGQNNFAFDTAATAGGGSFNKARGKYSVVGGGGGAVFADSNAANGNWSTVGGGARNAANGVNSKVGGGFFNRANGSLDAIVGGQSNLASGNAAFIGGGEANSVLEEFCTVSGGQQNVASASGATVPGGSLNTASGTNSFAAGNQAKAVHGGAFVWADNNFADFSSSTANEFNARASGGTRIYSNVALTAGVTLAAGASAWVAVSDSTLKRNIRALDGKEMLEKVIKLPIKRWSYRAQDPSIEHIGPMAQDFYPLFKVGDDEKTISTIDPPGIALAAIQGLYQMVQELKAENNELKERIYKLEKSEPQAQVETGQKGGSK